MGLEKREQKTYAKILSAKEHVKEGLIRVQTGEDNPEALVRDFEDSQGVKGTKYELAYKKISGHIIAIEFRDSPQYGKSILVTFGKDTEEDDDIILQMSTESNFAEDFMKKLPNVDFSKRVTFLPFAFTGDDKKEKKGVSLFQGVKGSKEKVQSYFYDAEKKEYINGLPLPEGDTKKYQKDDWIIHYMKVRKFLVEHTMNEVIPALEGVEKMTDDQLAELAQDNTDTKEKTVEEKIAAPVKEEDEEDEIKTPEKPEDMF